MCLRLQKPPRCGPTVICSYTLRSMSTNKITEWSQLPNEKIAGLGGRSSSSCCNGVFYIVDDYLDDLRVYMFRILSRPKIKIKIRVQRKNKRVLFAEFSFFSSTNQPTLMAFVGYVHTLLVHCWAWLSLVWAAVASEVGNLMYKRRGENSLEECW